jgi:light-regulated signal transduction histidine kinase (bacteriophytochrome)
MNDQVVWVARDITKRRQAEESLKACAARLKQHNRELQGFVRVASLDLQKPPRKVRTLADRVMSKYAAALDNRGRDYLMRMESEAARMQELIDDLLTLSRVIARARPFEPVNLNEVAEEVVSDLEVRVE